MKFALNRRLEINMSRIQIILRSKTHDQTKFTSEMT